jgi:hypothetical protein
MNGCYQYYTCQIDYPATRCSTSADYKEKVFQATKHSAANRSSAASARHVANKPPPTGLTPDADDRLSCSETKPSNLCRRLLRQLRPPHGAYNLRAIDRRYDASGFDYQDVFHRALTSCVSIDIFRASPMETNGHVPERHEYPSACILRATISRFGSFRMHSVKQIITP